MPVLNLTRGQVSPGLKILAHECAGYGEYRFEYLFAPTRRYRFDLCWPGLKVALEREGATWQAGRHTRGAGYRDDCRKYNLAAALGWSLVRATADMIEDGSALADLEAVLKMRAAAPPT